MHRISLNATASELLAHLEWARDSGLDLRWMGQGLPEAIEMVRIEVEAYGQQIELGMPYVFEVEDPEHIMLFMLKGFKVDKDALIHHLPYEGASIYRRLIEIADGKVSNTAPRFDSSWACWLEGDNRAIRGTETLEEFKLLYFGSTGLLRREIALLERLAVEGYHTEGYCTARINADAIVQRWGTAENGVKALREVLDYAN